MRMFTVTYDRSGRVATATVQGNEIATVDDLLCIREDGMPLATFPKQSVLQITSHSPDDDRPAPVEELGMPVRGPLDAHVEGREQYWTRLRNALAPAPSNGTALRRAPAGGEVRRPNAADAADSVRSSAFRAR